MKYFLLTLAIYASFGIVGLNKTASAQESDQKALEILEKLAKKTDAMKGFYTAYTLLVEDLADEKNNLQYSGEIWYLGDKYKMIMMGQVLYSDGTTNWVYQEDIDEVTVTSFSEEEQSENLIDPYFLIENYAKDYTCRFVADKFENNRPLVEIHLFPNDIEESTYSRIKLKIDKSQNELYEFTLVGNEGINYIIQLNKFDGITPVSADIVTFKESDYPDAEIIDMRD